jgi:serine/threonine-protein kinase
MIDQLNAAFAERYVVERELGRGGMAAVYLADDPKHGRRVAIKVLHPELDPSRTSRWSAWWSCSTGWTS